jgi:hypothetical protein
MQLVSIDDIFGEYEKRKNEEGIKEAENKKKEDENRKAFYTFLSNSITPKLHELSIKINEKGYHSEVKQDENNHVYPGVTFSFSPEMPKSLDSKIEFKRSEDNQVKIITSLYGPKQNNDRYNRYENPPTVIAQEKCNNQLIEYQVLEFIKNVLKLY